MDRTELHNSIVSNTSFVFARSGGKGGQNVNKVNTKVHASIALSAIGGISDTERQRLAQKLSAIINKDGQLFVDVDDERYQERNRAIALSRIEERIIRALRTQKKRIRTKPTNESKEKRLRLKKIKSEIKKNRRRIRDL